MLSPNVGKNLSEVSVHPLLSKTEGHMESTVDLQWEAAEVEAFSAKKLLLVEVSQNQLNSTLGEL